MSLTPAGYFPKITALPPGFRAPAHVVEVCSVSGCVNQGPEGWIDLWIHNELFLFNSLEDARSAAAHDERFEVFAYRILDARFADGRREQWTPEPPPIVEPLPEGYRSIGFDAVSRLTGPMFECSPLSCNYMALEIPVNQYCLAGTLDAAIAMAVRFSKEKPEPGDYYVFEVFRASAIIE